MSRVQHSGLISRVFFHSLLVAPLVRIQDVGDAPAHTDTECFVVENVHVKSRRQPLDTFLREMS